MGRKKRPYYRIVAVDSRRKRDGAFIEKVGYYHPLENPVKVEIESDKALKWLRDGAIPSDTVLSLFRQEGLWLRFRLEKRGLPEAQIDTMMNEWFTTHKKDKAVAPAKKAAAKAAPAPAPKAAEPIAAITAAPVVAAVVAAVAAPIVAEPEPAPVAAEPVAAETTPIVEEAAPAVEAVSIVEEAAPAVEEVAEAPAVKEVATPDASTEPN